MALSLLPGTLLAPVAAGASLFSAIFGSDAYANETKEVEILDNSQTVPLLSADVSSVSVAPKKKDGASEVNGEIGGSIVSGSALAPAVSPKSIAMGGADLDIAGSPSDDISVYVVRKGDAIAQIADMFGVSVNTILWANDLKKGGTLKEGDTLLILPISGVRHEVAKGETIQSIAKKYHVDTLTITSFNGIDENTTLALGEELIIPDAEMPNDTPSRSVAKKGSTIKSALKAIGGYFINPVPELKRKSQGLHGPGNRGVDLAAATGTRILASAGGTVLIARNGYNGGYGNMVTIQHPNGTKTLYAHMSKITTTTGAKVAQGEVIGYVGSTGRSTGPHLHFEVFNAKNPGSDWSWAK